MQSPDFQGFFIFRGTKMLEKINKDIITAKKAGKKFEAMVLTTLKSELLKNEKEKKPRELEDVILSYSRKLKKGLEAFEAAKADTDTLSQLQYEIGIISNYGPVLYADDFIKEGVENYFCVLGSLEGIKAGEAIKFLKEQLGKQNGAAIAKFVMAYIKENKPT